MQRRRFVRATGVIAVCTVGLAGCGSPSEDGGGEEGEGGEGGEEGEGGEGGEGGEEGGEEGEGEDGDRRPPVDA